MAKLTSAQRAALSTSEFALPGRRYPVSDRGHAIAAKGRAAQQRAKGNLTAAEEATIDRRANAVLHRPKKA